MARLDRDTQQASVREPMIVSPHRLAATGWPGLCPAMMTRGMSAALAELRQFEVFEGAKALKSFGRTPRGLHYSRGIDRVAAAVILGKG
jgi:hypothetical protein